MNKQNTFVSPYIGYILDCWRLALRRFTNPHSLMKYCLIKDMQKATNAACFIETGTYKGVTTRRVSKLFKYIETIEISDYLVRQAHVILDKYDHIKLIHGDCVMHLPECLKRCSGRGGGTIIFLDGHFSGGVTECSDQAEPACDALDIIARHSDSISAVIIDDFRLFGKQDGFPSKSALFKSIELNFPVERFEVTERYDIIFVIKRNDT